MLIGDVARRTGVSARMLRHYDTLGLVRPTGRTHGGYREYTADDLRRILYVEGLRTLGLSLRQIGRTLDDPGFTPAALVGDLIRRTEERLAADRELLDRLHAVDVSEPAGWPDVARIVGLLHGLDSPDAARRQQAVLAPAAVPADLLARAVLSESDPNVAGALRWALARAGADGIAGLAAGAASADADVRRRALQAVAGLPGDEAVALLTEALSDTDAAVRRQAARALGVRGVPAAVPTLIAMVVDGPNDVEAGELLGALAADPTLAAPILAALTAELAAPDTGPAARLRLTQALAELPGSLAHDLLRDLSTDGDRPVSLLATALLSRSDRQ
ncbi:MerR family transcriptional regulator [Actinoplanes sp. SE50]|uniref:MerR family transcriptional regulator n=1 Tax=unclassified Actinoplanes TaxID=2626549 RepID=UPI00023ED24C|nr:MULTISPECIES: MerR family transcriptional regulator [unclassified Actinoplanes]AEV84950.1 Deoxyhypusine hydroxylase [Actinoplanes sp. SE50/110]ATO83341.1 MerR family transcriptional regulator [Actinoplanes sp. SE50]SLM00748.1 MerR-family transcriptional regulator [Actinoplanes sp. SE50/110]